MQDIIDKIIIEDNDLSTPPSCVLLNNENVLNNTSNSINENLLNLNENNNIIIENNQKEIKHTLNIIDELDNFINNTFKLLNANNELGDFKGSLTTLRENLLGRKIRVSFIGNISVGKSTVLNCIIGEKILPTKETECTYRGVIIRHKNINNFELYRTKLISKGVGYDKYYYFQDEDKPYTKGIQNIKSYLNNKNNDKDINDEDAYIVIVGKLKIFDFIKLDESLIQKIEFIDLPGPDRKNNTFNENKYYQKILRFSNCCVYINEPKTINDENNVNRMREQYLSDKNKVCPNLRQKFIQTCLFLINKSDTIEEEDKKKIIDVLIKTIPESNINEGVLNISFFSGKSFNEYLEYYHKYVFLLENNPLYLLKSLYHEWSASILYVRSFKHYIVNRISDKIEEKFDLNLDQEIEIPSLFYNDIKPLFNILYKNNFRGISDKDEDEIIKKLYIINSELKNKNFDETIYSTSFFSKIKDVIIFSEDLQNKNLNNSINQFFSHADDLFNKEIKKEDETQKKENEEKYIFIKKILIPKTEILFKEKQKKIIDIIELAKYKCNEIFEEEVKNIDERLKSVDKDVEKAAKILQNQIEKILNDMNKDQENEVKSLLSEIEKLLEDNIKEFYDQKNLPKSEIDTNKGITMKMVISLFTSTLSGIAVRSGLVLVAQSVVAGAAAGATAAAGTSLGTTVAGALLGPLGIAIGLGVGIAISLTTFLIHWFSKSKRYKNGIEEYQKKIKEQLNNFKSSFESDFVDYKDSIIKDLNIRVEILKKDINSMDKKKWDQLKQMYLSQKNSIKEKIKNKMYK